MTYALHTVYNIQVQPSPLLKYNVVNVLYPLDHVCLLMKNVFCVPYSPKMLAGESDQSTKILSINILDFFCTIKCYCNIKCDIIKMAS